MRVLFMTNEYPPYIYGGAGVHVEYLSRELAKRTPVEVRSFHDQIQRDGQLTVRGTKVDPDRFPGCPKEFVSPLRALATCLEFNGQGIDADVVHCHTWYAQFGGLIAKLLYGIPFVLTVHSLEPLRPWKREQLGRGYALSSWIERTALEKADAVVAVSNATRDDVLRLFDVDPAKVPVIPNGIDTEEYQPIRAPEVLAQYGVDPERPFVLFVGRMTKQKGLQYLLDAAEAVDPSFQIVIAGGGADTPEGQRAMEDHIAAVKARRPDVVFISEMLSRPAAVALYSHATVFCCPSIYEPFGIINLEAMSCGTPVVGSNTGGIREVVVEGETGFKVPLALADEPPHDPSDPQGFSRGLAEAINRFAGRPDLAAEMGAAGRRRVLDHYSWGSIAEQTLELYRRLTTSAPAASS
jgi:glycogen synthase